jgi:hypothetical protein
MNGNEVERERPWTVTDRLVTLALSGGSEGYDLRAQFGYSSFRSRFEDGIPRIEARSVTLEPKAVFGDADDWDNSDSARRRLNHFSIFMITFSISFSSIIFGVEFISVKCSFRFISPPSVPTPQLHPQGCSINHCKESYFKSLLRISSRQL